MLRRTRLAAGLSAAALTLVLAAPAQAAYSEGNINCASTHQFSILSDTWSTLTTNHTYFSESGSGYAYPRTTKDPYRTRSPFLRGTWAASNNTAYEGWQSFSTSCILRPV